MQISEEKKWMTKKDSWGNFFWCVFFSRPLVRDAIRRDNTTFHTNKNFQHTVQTFFFSLFIHILYITFTTFVLDIIFYGVWRKYVVIPTIKLFFYQLFIIIIIIEETKKIINWWQWKYTYNWSWKHSILNG